MSQLVGDAPIYVCDVEQESQIGRVRDEIAEREPVVHGLVHSIAFAKPEDLSGRFADTSKDGYQLALEVSAYTLSSLARRAEPLMDQGGGIVALTYLGSERVVPNYNVMGVAKAALEAGVRYLASELGPKQIRVNSLSAGPLKTLASRGIKDFVSMHQAHADKSALKRNTEEIGRAHV